MNALVLCARNLVVGYDQPVLSEINIELPNGVWWAVLGPNGCGKSTLLETLAGRLAPLQGDIQIDGHALNHDPVSAKRSLGYAVPPERLPQRLTGRECLNVFATLNGNQADSESVCRLIETWDFQADLQQFVDRMSLGMRQKLGVLLALAGRPRLVIMDESLNGLDPASALSLKRFLQAQVERKACSVLMATHALDVVEQYADGALVCDRGRIAVPLDRGDLDTAAGCLDQLIAERLSRERRQL